MTMATGTSILGLPCIASPKTHSLGKSLFSYVSMKIHPAVLSRSWSRIVVLGLHDRHLPAQISPTEKSGKRFNWQRPTAKIIDSATLQINCFPGKDYVEHYASLIATYLALSGQDPTIVDMIQPSPSDCKDAIARSNLAQMGSVDTVIIGYVHHLESLLQTPWEGGGDLETSIFAWKKLKRGDGESVALLGCTTSFWGDVSGHLVRALQTLNDVKTVLYVSKAGTLCPDYAPNEFLATGNSAFINGRIVRWENVLQSHCQMSSRMREGSNITVPTPLVEDQIWLKLWQPRCQWVDCEVGHLAQASIDGGISFGYIHIISDNVAREYEYDLSNERLPAVVLARGHLFHDIKEILTVFLQNKI